MRVEFRSITYRESALTVGIYIIYENAPAVLERVELRSIPYRKSALTVDIYIIKYKKLHQLFGRGLSFALSLIESLH